MILNFLKYSKDNKEEKHSSSYTSFNDNDIEGSYLYPLRNDSSSELKEVSPKAKLPTVLIIGTKEEESIAYVQQVRFYQEHLDYRVEDLRDRIMKAEQTDEFQNYAKIEKSYLARNKFRLLLATPELKELGDIAKEQNPSKAERFHRELIAKINHEHRIQWTPKQPTRSLTVPPNTPEEPQNNPSIMDYSAIPNLELNS
jgi:hypothetical protein